MSLFIAKQKVSITEPRLLCLENTRLLCLELYNSFIYSFTLKFSKCVSMYLELQIFYSVEICTFFKKCVYKIFLFQLYHLPVHYFATLRYLMYHLKKVVEHSPTNKVYFKLYVVYNLLI